MTSSIIPFNSDAKRDSSLGSTFALFAIDDASILSVGWQFTAMESSTYLSATLGGLVWPCGDNINITRCKPVNLACVDPYNARNFIKANINWC